MAHVDDGLTRGIARFRTEDGEVTGSGFLIAEGTLCTCAHVVARTLGTEETDPLPPEPSVTVDFPLLSPAASPPLRARVVHWRPVGEDGGGDIALLTLEGGHGGDGRDGRDGGDGGGCGVPVPGTAPVRFAGGAAVWDHPFRVLGFPRRTGDHGVWVQGRLRAPVGRGWTSMEAREAFHGPAIGQGFSGAPVWDTEQGGVVGMTVAADRGSGATTAYLIPAALLLGLDPSLRASPFRGLEPFREQDAPVFFARHADSERIAAAVRTTPFVPVVGASGVGKSSLVRAGVLPLLRASGYTVTDFVGQPDTYPVTALAAALNRQFPAAPGSRHGPAWEVPEDRATERTVLERAVLEGARILEQAGTAGHVIVLDQFEETVGTRPDEARALLDTLLPMTRATRPGGGSLRVLATLRSASMEELVAGGRAQELSGTVQMVGPLTPGQLDEIVRRPVDGIPGVEFEPGLAELVVADAGSEPGALPLVEFALAELWERQEHGRLTHAAYREIGGVEGALSRYADHQLAQVCKEPEGPDEATARRLFERLARPAKGREFTRVACGFEQLPAELRAAAQALARTRLLVIGRDSSGRETVALAHESLVRQWPTLRSWLDESRAFLLWHDRLGARLREWDAAGRQSELLLRGRELSAARPMAALRPGELSSEEVEFIRLSRLDRRRSVRRGRTGVALVACLALLAAGLSYVAWDLNRDQERDRRDSAAQKLVEQADALSDSPVDAALLALAAARTSDTAQTRAALMRHELPLSALESVHRLFPAGDVRSTATSADGHRMAVLHNGPRGIRVYVVSGLGGHDIRSTPLPGAPPLADAVTVSDDGTKVAAGGPDGAVRIWEVGEGERAVAEEPLAWTWSPDRTAARTATLDFSADGRRLLHFVGGPTETCDGLDTWIRLVEVDTKEVGGPGQAPPDGMLKPGECVYDTALRSDRADRLTLVAGRETEDGAEALYAVRTGDVSTGRVATEQSGLEDGTLVGGGRTLATQRKADRVWRSRLTTPRETPGKVRLLRAEAFTTDATGQFLTQEGVHDSMRAGKPDVQLSVIHDLVTGRRYSALLPAPAIDSSAVVRRGSAAPALYFALGQDLLEFRTHATRYPLGSADSTDAMDYAPDNRAIVALLTAPVDSDGTSMGPPYIAISDADGLRRKPLSAELTADDITVSADGDRLVDWYEDGWELRSTDDLVVTEKQKSPTRNGTVVADRSLGVTAVTRHGRDDFLLLDRSGVSLLDGTSGERSLLRELDCAWKSAMNRHACVAALGRPGHPRELFVLRADGSAELWRVRQGHAEKTETSARIGPLLVDDPDYAPTHAVVRSDGAALAVTTRDGVFVWRPGHGKPALLSAGSTLVGPYDESGLLVLSPAGDNPEEVWDDGSASKVASLPVSYQVGAWLFTGRLLSGATEMGLLSYDLRRLKDNSTSRLCQLLGPNPPDIRKSLPDSFDVPPGADMRPPCRNRG
ncbi:serine protease [Streptomyces sp. BH-SS-21]|uniref:Serine protease n=1 Tax=Streptomyces liliiviolaceus TaxID=2823109 RepID=A0A940Y3L1_9ACTN|nr:serine protease [Streptomyces liliiviolaceus]MBQ0849999.1 serine protease [Streptomyces liliiviolaceus]